MLRQWCGIELLVVLFFVVLSGCGPHNEAAETEPSSTYEVRTVLPSRGSLQETLEVKGQVVPSPGAKAEVSSLVSGRVESVAVRDGDHVEAGQELARLNALEYEQKVNEARARLHSAQATLKKLSSSSKDDAIAAAAQRLENAKADVERVRALLEKGMTSEKRMREAELELKSAEAGLLSAKQDAGVGEADVGAAQATLAEAETQLNYTKIVAPISGIIAARQIEPGEYVEAGKKIFELIDLARVEAECCLPVIYLSRVQKEQPVDFLADAYPRQSFAGQVLYVGSQTVPSMDAVSLRARLDNSEEALKVGMFGSVKVNVSANVDSLILPRTAVLDEGDEHYVLTVNDNHAVKVTVEIGLVHGDKVEVLSGLEENTPVIDKGYGLEEGAAIKVVS